MILCLPVLIQYWHVTNTQTDTQTHDDSIYHTIIASRGKKYNTITNSKQFNEIFQHMSENYLL